MHFLESRHKKAPFQIKISMMLAIEKTMKKCIFICESSVFMQNDGTLKSLHMNFNPFPD